jgi:hypothetical protein
MGKVKFKNSLTQAQYNALGAKDSETLYFTSDTKRLYKGADLISNAVAGLSFDSSTFIVTATNVDGTTAQISLAAAFATKVDADTLGEPNGVATLDGAGKVPASQLPSFVDDVLEYANLAAFPGSGESGIVYVALDTNKTYRWSGSEYIVIGNDLALGENSSTAYAGDKGKAVTDAFNAHKGAGGTDNHPLGNGSVAGFSVNDFTNDLKSKLEGIAAGATNTTVENSLTSTSTVNALSAAQGKALNDRLADVEETLTWS